jgi:GTP pyrophosphokinase
MVSIESLLNMVGEYASSAGLDVIRTAYSLLVSKCKPNEQMIARGLAVGEILAGLEAKAESVAAALLVDIPQEECDHAEIREAVGDIVADLVAGVQTMRQFPYLDSSNKRVWSSKEHFELYHAFVGSLEDPQWVLIEVAVQLGKLRDLDAYPPPEQRRIAFEAMNIYAPLAHRLGIWRVKWELEDKSFRLTNPEQYQEIASYLDEHRSSREEGIRQTIETLCGELERNGIRAEITGRPKHIYSIYRKMQRKGLPFEAIYDIRAIRVVVGDSGEMSEEDDQGNVEICYQVVGLISNMWTPIAGQFDDYIAAPKSNGYQSLHSAVLDEEGKTVEIQIRTRRMDKAAESGIAAHWRYKERHGSKPGSQKEKAQSVERAIETRISGLRALLVYSEDRDAVRLEQPPEEDRSSEPIFVFTPMGDVIRLPAGSTPIDFAYRIHTELGNRCYGAKVNGNIVPLKHQLNTGDRVEIVTRKRGGPNINWLSLEQGFIKTNEARKKISAWFRRQRREKNIARGHELLDRELARLGVKSSLSFDEVSRLLSFKRADEMLAQIGGGTITPERIRSAIAAASKPTREEIARKADEELLTEKDGSQTLIDKSPADVTAEKPGLLVASTEGLHARLAKCCYPVPPEDVVGYVTRGHGVTIHRVGCPNVVASNEGERIVSAGWGQVEQRSFKAMVVVEADNRRGLMGDIGATVAKEDTDISEAKGKRGARGAVFELLLDVHDAKQLEQVVLKLGQTKGVRKAYRKKG